MTDLVEVMARAIRDQDYSIVPANGAQNAARAARAALSALEAGGWRVVPAAVDEALGLADTIINRLPSNGEHWSLLQRYGAARSEMLAAAPKVTDGAVDFTGVSGDD